MDLDDYQERAGRSAAAIHEDEFRGRIAALLGLGSETGTLLDIQKKLLTGGVPPSVGAERAKQELGDLLWYVARVADAFEFKLNEIAEANLERSADMFGSDEASLSSLPEFDSAKERERFPRRMTFRFDEVDVTVGGKIRQRARIQLVAAEPNDFPEGPIQITAEKQIGYQVGGSLGDPLTDNSRREDGYRYHDAIHMAFMACLHWSATMRSLLKVKRKSDDDKDEEEDSARPLFLEEGLAAVLAALAPSRFNFETESSIDGDVLNAVKACTLDLEVADVHGWAWRQAIVTGFGVMRKLDENKGGLVTADLEARTLTFEPLPR